MAVPVLARIALQLLEVPDQLMQDWLTAAADIGKDRIEAYKRDEEFYDGERRSRLRDRARRYLETQNGNVPFVENFVEPCVDTLAERLRVVGFASSAASTTKVTNDAGAEVEETSDAPATLVEEWWQLDRLDTLQGKVHPGSLKRGDEFVIVDWDDDEKRPEFCRQIPSQCKIVYSADEPDTVAYAVKVWNTTQATTSSNRAGVTVRRLNVYWPGRIDKWWQATNGSPWQQWVDDDPDTARPMPWPTWWTTTGDETGDPLGVAMIHFRHLPGEDGYGRSRVKMAIPFQGELNKYLADLSDLIDRHALPQDWVTGVAGDMQLSLFGGVWKAPDKEASFGRLEAADTVYLLNAIEGVISRCARRMRIPMHLLTGGTPPSGEALKTSESGLVSTAETCQAEFGDAWEDALMLALRLNASLGEDAPKVPEGLRLFAQWKTPGTRSDAADVQVAEAKHRLGVSKHTLLEEMGYDPDKEAELRAGEQEEDAAILGKALGAGSPIA